MKIIQTGFLIAIVLFSTTIFAQSEIEAFVQEGIQYHDSGNYEKAIETYQKALKLDPKSTLVNYEIALSYFTKGDYKEAVKYSDVVLKHNEDYLLQAYITKGSSLDMLGKTKESIKLFKKAIKKVDGHYLLHYNLGLNYFKTNDFDAAEENVIKAIELNPNHSSSHLMLAHIHNQKGNSVQTLLATHYFLFLEPNSNRALEAYAMLQKNFGGNVTKDENKANTINILLSSNNDSQFGAAELMVSMLEASKSLEENEGKTDDEMFVQNTEKFFKILGELKKKKDKEIWWTFYTPFFYDIANSKHLETYCKYISQIGDENSKRWIAENESQLNEFDQWLKTN
ncbi:tetratricopeptide repeat protein [Flagellimonas okinawensis]|uniref:Tetratricopeptide repeat protein n=1 Tax=Flagellimonas okinawensis TaxID=3031324 RepID=A0ABT5XTA7_9FLAO|nr:tetratricopeptide repeat protein [[Muricauda] okinawensis]MDF0709117.1 tetratricopeptide repeat protein [[Muricauda] okinawensis]